MNGALKGQVSVMLNLTKGLFEDLVVHHQLPPQEINKDYQVLRSRTLNEGPEFLTKTLPMLAKSLDSALLDGKFKTPSSFKRRSGSKLPRFMHGLFKLVFSQEGVLLGKPDVEAIKSLRQLGYLFYKYQLPHNKRLVERLFREFAELDKDIPTSMQNAEQMSTVYYGQKVINAIFKNFSIENLKPKNGPGSVANGIKPYKRFRPTKFYPSLDSLVNYSNFYYYNDRHLFDQFDRYRALDYEFYGTAKALAVPKDSRGPRLISSEPSEFMTYQQALKNVMVPYLESHYLTAGRVNFTDQTINGNLALAASKELHLATLDLEKASDLVSLMLVDLLFEETVLHDYLMKSRSSYTELPSGELVPLNKFAPMGSALCFPVEAIVFFALLVGRRLAQGLPLKEAIQDIYVYGDDIIVPTDEVDEMIDALESVGLKVNQSKSCFSGKFRESCGVDAYDGVEVTPTRFKKLWQEKPEADTLVSWIAYGNNMFRKGYWKTFDVIKRLVEKTIGRLPLVSEQSPILGWTGYSHRECLKANRDRLHWCPELQAFMIKGHTLVSKARSGFVRGWDQMLRVQWEDRILGSDPFGFSASDSSAYTPRYRGVKRGSWVTEHEAF